MLHVLHLSGFTGYNASMLWSFRFKFTLLGYLYSAVIISSLNALFAFLPEPAFVWSLVWALLPAGLVLGMTQVLNKLKARAVGLRPFEAVLLANAVLLWLFIALEYK